jgi:hypothetical protein
MKKTKKLKKNRTVIMITKTLGENDAEISLLGDKSAQISLKDFFQMLLAVAKY